MTDNEKAELSEYCRERCGLDAKEVADIAQVPRRTFYNNNALLNTADWLNQLAGRASLGQELTSQSFPELEQKVMAFIRGKNMKVGDIITVGNSFRLSFYQSLNPLEQSQLEACLQSMHDNGLLAENLALTDAGLTAVYA